MKITIAVMLSLSLGAGLALAQPDSVLKSEQDKVSYVIGLRYGRSLKRHNVEVDPGKFRLGLEDAMAGGRQLLTDVEMQRVMKAFQQKRVGRQRMKAEANRKAGEAFLAKNRKAKGVSTTASGLQYQVLRAGKGSTPKVTDTVRTHYRGILLSGKEFDSSYRRNKSATFPVGQVIRGWGEALQLMKVGAKWKLWVPSKLAYGERGSPPSIGPGSMLIFEIELLAIE